MRINKAYERSHCGYAGIPGIPRASGFTVSFVLFPGTGLSCPRRQHDAKHRRQLSASVGAPEPRDFAVRKPHRSSLGLVSRPPHPASTSVTIAIRPSFVRRDGNGYMADLGEGKSEKFPAKDWTTTQISEPGRRSLARCRENPNGLDLDGLRVGNLF